MKLVDLITRLYIQYDSRGQEFGRMTGGEFINTKDKYYMKNKSAATHSNAQKIIDYYDQIDRIKLLLTTNSPE